MIIATEGQKSRQPCGTKTQVKTPLEEPFGQKKKIKTGKRTKRYVVCDLAIVVMMIQLRQWAELNPSP
jgi:hypothetical protein